MFETERLLIREFLDEDFAQVHEYASQLSVMRFVIYRVNRPEDTWAFINRAKTRAGEIPRRNYELAVTVKQHHDALPILIGGSGLTVDGREAEIGYCYNQRYWGHGYATEALRGMIGYGFEQLGLHRIYGRCNSANQPSAAVMRKVGMQREGVFRQKIFAYDQWWDEEVYAILEDDWRHV